MSNLEQFHDYPKRRWYSWPHVWVIIAFTLGVVVGAAFR